MKKPGFTLVELLVAISIIGILTGLASVSYSGVQRRSRDAQRKNDLSQLKVVLSNYYYAQNPASYLESASKTAINNSTDPLSVALKPNYIQKVPVDPKNTGSYLYKYQSFNNASSFKLFATLENKEDKKGWANGSAWVVDGYVVGND